MEWRLSSSISSRTLTIVDVKQFFLKSKMFEAKNSQCWRCLKQKNIFKLKKLSHFNNCWWEKVFQSKMFEANESLKVEKVFKSQRRLKQKKKLNVEDVWMEWRLSSSKSSRTLTIVDVKQFFLKSKMFEGNQSFQV